MADKFIEGLKKRQLVGGNVELVAAPESSSKWNGFRRAEFAPSRWRLRAGVSEYGLGRDFIPLNVI